jgi:hypothetical protein
MFLVWIVVVIKKICAVLHGASYLDPRNQGTKKQLRMGNRSVSLQKQCHHSKRRGTAVSETIR